MVVFRSATDTDYGGIAACLGRNNLSVPTEAEWRHHWDNYPYAADFGDIPRGFVLEENGVIVGTVFNLWAKYWHRGRVLRVAIAGSIAVDPAHRNGSIKLIGEMLRQPGIDLYLNGSPSETTSKILDALKVRRVPQADYDLSLLWAARGYSLALAGLRLRRVPLASAVAIPAGIALQSLSRLKLRRRGSQAAHPVSRAVAFTEEFDDLWLRRRAESQRLLAFRDRATLQWRYGSLLERDRARLLVVRRDDGLAGYAVLVRSARPKLGLEQYAIHDIQCIGDDSDLVAALLRAAFRETRADRLDLLEWVGNAGRPRETAETDAALRHRVDVWQAYYHTTDASLKTELQESDRWAFGLYDSD